jgi:uncharacterized protein YndB with AHSA1/START domain
VIVKTVWLPCTPERAFVLFTERAGEWWPATRRHTDDPTGDIQIEAAGRFFERANDGVEIELGAVRIFEPGRRLVLDWYPGTGPENPTLVEISFEPAATGTQITVTHSPGHAGREVFDRDVAAYDRSWTAVLAALDAQAAISP